MPHPDRREFLTLLAVAGTDTLWPRLRSIRRPHPPGIPVVVAEPTPFFAHPDGQRCLVRFLVSDVDAPAGRMRAFDRTGQQIGTAGVLPRGDGRLFGELWLPLGALPRVRTQLEAPGLGRPLVTWHDVTPRPRWTIHWMALLDPDGLQRHLASLDAIARAAEVGALQRSGALVNPLPSSPPANIGDLPYLRMAEPGERVATLTGIARGPVVAMAGTDLRVPGAAAVLLASGVTTVVLTDAVTGGLRWLGPATSRLLVAAAAPDASPERLAFVEGGDRMARQVERYLSGLGASGETGAAGQPTVLVSGGGVEDMSRAADAVRDWNARFAYPRIVVGDAAALRRAAPRGLTTAEAAWSPPPPPTRPAPSLTEVTEHAARREAESARRARAMIECLAPLVPGTGTGLERIAAQLATPAAGALVFNPTPYGRTEVVPMPDGSDRLVTNIPALGYAYVPEGMGDGGRWRAMETEGGQSPYALRAGPFRVALDPNTGAIESLTSLDGREWARATVGLNAVRGARLEEAVRETLPGVGVRVIARRRTPWNGEIRTVVTAYEGLSWIDVVNQASGPAVEPVTYQFAFELDAALAEWEVPAGADRATPPCDCAHLRWVRLTGGRGSALFAARQSGFGRVEQDGTIVSHSAPGESRFRLTVRAPGSVALPDDPWRFGWGVEPALVAPVPGTGGATLPTFGPLLVLDQTGMAVVGVQAASDGNGVIVYLQELTGLSRIATLGAGLLGFEDARQVDLVERQAGPPVMVMRNGVGVTLPARGVAAVRLLGVDLAGA